MPRKAAEDKITKAAEEQALEKAVPEEASVAAEEPAAKKPAGKTAARKTTTKRTAAKKAAAVSQEAVAAGADTADTVKETEAKKPAAKKRTRTKAAVAEDRSAVEEAKKSAPRKRTSRKKMAEAEAEAVVQASAETEAVAVAQAVAETEVIAEAQAPAEARAVDQATAETVEANALEGAAVLADTAAGSIPTQMEVPAAEETATGTAGVAVGTAAPAEMPVIGVTEEPAAGTTEQETAVAEDKEASPDEEEAGLSPVGTVEAVQEVKEAAEVKDNEKRTLLFVAAECQPFSGTGGLGEVAGSLPTALAASGKYDVTVVSPYYRDMPWEWKEKCEFVKYFYVKLAWRSQYCGIFRLVLDGVTYIFIDNEYYFGRTGLYGYYDDGERYAFFSKAIMDMMSQLDYYPDIVHTNDWQAALIPVYNTYLYHYSFKSIFTIHNIAFQGQYSLDIFESVFGLPQEAKQALEYNGCINLMKGAIECSHIVSTVSKSYVDELASGFYSFNMENIINRNASKMRGILNGINYVAYDPENDPNIAAPFSAEDLSGKAADKKNLQEILGLTIDPDAPLIALISRLTSQKGLTLVRTVMENLLQERMQFVVLGVGEAEFEDYFRYLADRYPGKVSTNIMFNGGLSHRIYAGADIFLMPSLTEPCGLAQMISCRYGTVPIIRETGGLKDSIKDCTYGEGNGFTFAGLDPYQLEDAVRRALALYADKDKWEDLKKHIMGIDFSWKKSAAEYDAMYDELFA